MDWEKLGKKLLFPPLWLMTLLVIISAVALTFSVILIVNANKEIRRIKNGE